MKDGSSYMMKTCRYALGDASLPFQPASASGGGGCRDRVRMRMSMSMSMSTSTTSLQKNHVKVPAGKRRRSFPKGYGLKSSRKVVLDGANLCWSYGREKVKGQGLGTGTGREVPDIEGLRVALSSSLWEELSIEPVVFLPTTCEHYANWGYYECSLDKELLFDSHQLVCVENGCVAQRIKCQIKSKNRDRESIRDDSAVTKTSLRHKFQRATRSASPQGHKSSRSRRQNRRREAASKSIQSRDDILLLRFAQKHNAWVLSNDQFRDHSVIHRRGWSGWLKERRIGYEFLRQESKTDKTEAETEVRESEREKHQHQHQQEKEKEKEDVSFELKILGSAQWEEFVSFRSRRVENK